MFSIDVHFLSELKCCRLNYPDNFLFADQWNRTNPWWDSCMSNETKHFPYPHICYPVDEYLDENRIYLERTIGLYYEQHLFVSSGLSSREVFCQRSCSTDHFCQKCPQRTTDGSLGLVRSLALTVVFNYTVEMSLYNQPTTHFLSSMTFLT